MTTLTTTAPAVIKRVSDRDPITKDYAAYVSIDGGPEEYIGSRWSAGAAERLCDEYAYTFYVDRHTPEVAARFVVESFEPAPAPPVDDGPEDNFGGFRCPRRVHIAAPTPDLALPPIELLAEVAVELATAAQDAGDTANMHALNKAMMQLHAGTMPVPTTGGFLIESRTRGGVVHRLSTVHGCSCEAGRSGKPCWHCAAIELIVAAQQYCVTV